jgi:hypothetical protein
MVTLRNLEEGTLMRRIALLLVAVATVAGVVASTAPLSGHVDEEPPRSLESKFPLPRVCQSSRLCFYPFLTMNVFWADTFDYIRKGISREARYPKI